MHKGILGLKIFVSLLSVAALSILSANAYSSSVPRSVTRTVTATVQTTATTAPTATTATTATTGTTQLAQPTTAAATTITNASVLPRLAGVKLNQGLTVTGAVRGVPIMRGVPIKGRGFVTDVVYKRVGEHFLQPIAIAGTSQFEAPVAAPGKMVEGAFILNIKSGQVGRVSDRIAIPKKFLDEADRRIDATINMDEGGGEFREWEKQKRFMILDAGGKYFSNGYDDSDEIQEVLVMPADQQEDRGWLTKEALAELVPQLDEMASAVIEDLNNGDLSMPEGLAGGFNPGDSQSGAGNMPEGFGDDQPEDYNAPPGDKKDEKADMEEGSGDDDGRKDDDDIEEEDAGFGGRGLVGPIVEPYRLAFVTDAGGNSLVSFFGLDGGPIDPWVRVAAQSVSSTSQVSAWFCPPRPTPGEPGEGPGLSMQSRGSVSYGDTVCPDNVDPLPIP